MKLWGYFKDLFGSFRKRGVYGTLRLLLPELLFDWRFGTDTFRLVSREDLNSHVKSSNKTFGGGYQGANSYLFGRAMSEARKVFGENFNASTFVDFGCGKGRAILMATDYGFKKTIGVEYCPDLVSICKENIEIYSKRARHNAEIVSVYADAAEYEIPNDAGFFFFFNPFSGEVLEPVLKRIQDSLFKHPRPSCFVYMNPVYPEVFESLGFEKVSVVSATSATNPDAILYRSPVTHQVLSKPSPAHHSSSRTEVLRSGHVDFPSSQ